jgi:hypothetical protein
MEHENEQTNVETLDKMNADHHFKLRLAKIRIKGGLALALVSLSVGIYFQDAPKEVIAFLGPLVGAAVNGIYRDLRDK